MICIIQLCFFSSSLNKRSSCVTLLQIVEQVVQVDVGLPVDALTDQEGQFVGILTRCRNSHNSLNGGRKKKQKTDIQHER